MSRFYYDPILGLVHWSFVEPTVFDYSKQKNRWVAFDNGKPKTKLRQYIFQRANHISELSQGHSIELKNIFIEAYNLEGIPGVDKVYKHTIKSLIKNAQNVKAKN